MNTCMYGVWSVWSICWSICWEYLLEYLSTNGIDSLAASLWLHDNYTRPCIILVGLKEKRKRRRMQYMRYLLMHWRSSSKFSEDSAARFKPKEWSVPTSFVDMSVLR